MKALALPTLPTHGNLDVSRDISLSRTAGNPRGI
jgi:hypothetical protein